MAGDEAPMIQSHTSHSPRLRRDTYRRHWYQRGELMCHARDRCRRPGDRGGGGGQESSAAAHALLVTGMRCSP
jgi:hypothetical protein